MCLTLDCFLLTQIYRLRMSALLVDEAIVAFTNFYVHPKFLDYVHLTDFYVLRNVLVALCNADTFRKWRNLFKVV